MTGDMMTEFPKPLKHMKSGYQVYLYKVPDVGELFWSIVGKGQKAQARFYRVVAVQESIFNGTRMYRIFWVDNERRLYSSGVRAKAMSRIRTKVTKEEIVEMVNVKNNAIICSGQELKDA
jgi:predicted RNA-binding protein YlxR (DUF448 family)